MRLDIATRVPVAVPKNNDELKLVEKEAEINRGIVDAE